MILWLQAVNKCLFVCLFFERIVGLFDQKSYDIVKYYYNLKQLFSILSYFKM